MTHAHTKNQRKNLDEVKKFPDSSVLYRYRMVFVTRIIESFYHHPFNYRYRAVSNYKANIAEYIVLNLPVLQT